MKSPITCTAVSHSIFIRSDGGVNACCTASWPSEKALEDSLIHKETQSLEQHFSNNNTIKRIKDSLENGEFAPECLNCQKYESSGLRSLRKRLEIKFGKPTIDGSLRHINIEIGNICNFRCLYCGPIFSSAWGPESKIQEKHSISNGYQPNSKWLENPELIPYLIKKIKESRSDRVEIEIVGGEPFLSPFHDVFLNAILENQLEHSVDLLYSSNMSLIKEAQIDLLKKFSNVELLLSIDSLNPERFHYIRFPGELDSVLKNFKILREHGIFVRPFITIHALNIKDLPALLSWSIDMKIPPAFNFVDNPSLFHLSVAPKRVREETIFKIKNLKFSRKEQLIDALNREVQSPLELEKLKSYLADLDQARGLNYKGLFDLD